jgi:hypothetical protein
VTSAAADYYVALLARMQDQTLDLRPRDFANDSIQPNDRPRFLERVAERGLDPDTTFEKDISLAKVQGFRMVFEHGMILVGRRDDLDGRVRVPDASGAQGVVIQDTLKRLTGR